MKTVKDVIVKELVIKNSRFIGILMPLQRKEEVDNSIKRVKEKYRDATHYCYGYIINENKHFSDDGEPGGTAGRPILHVLEANNLNYVLAIVVRYFGGIKLGAGGLVSAYTKSVTNLLDEDKMVELIKGYNIKMTFDYNYGNEVNYLLKDMPILDRDFKMRITYVLNVPMELLEVLQTKTYIDMVINDEVDIPQGK